MEKKIASTKPANNKTEKDTGDNESNISEQELNLLDTAGEDDEERALHDAELDTTDNEGELLNERSSANSKSGRDLDVPGSEDDDDAEDLGEEDEENNSYSLGADKEDQNQ